jgi:DtxR family Mn-dependent transcriptional regulator
MPTVSVENYLKALYHLQQALPDGRVTTTALAAQLGITPASTTNMLKWMAAEGLVDYVAYRGATLSDAGRRAALRVIRNHRLVETFLVEALGFAWHEVHDEAERLEHAMSDLLADRIDAWLGHPEQDPHGDPIPRGEGYCDPPVDMRLCEGPEPPVTIAIRRVLTQESGALQDLQAQGLVPGSRWLLVARHADHVLLQHRSGRTEAVDTRTAGLLCVVPAPP